MQNVFVIFEVLGILILGYGAWGERSLNKVVLIAYASHIVSMTAILFGSSEDKLVAIVAFTGIFVVIHILVSFQGS